MCGICGFIGEDEKRIATMTNLLRHRGPDGNAVFVGEGVSLGHARLAILDPTAQGNQPMWNEKRTVAIVYNGEIYNYRRLKTEFNLSCKTGTDTEVLLKLYEREGIGFVKRLRGMFAFGLYDTTTKTLHLVRDSSGIKPLYRATIDGKTYFASEMRVLMSIMPIQPTLNLESLSAYMKLQYVPGPATMCTGIDSVIPGTIVSFKEGKETTVVFSPDEPRVSIASKKEFCEKFPEIMQRVVEDHMISDKPIGIFLSGGMDSSILLHHMARASRTPIKTFTVRFDASENEDAARFNRDADLALLTAQHYGTDHEELLLTAEEYRNLYRHCARSLDLPNADSVAVAQFALARMAKKKVDVVLSGAGGDELFGGYPRYRIARILHALQWIPAPVRGIAARLLGQPEDVLRMDASPELALRLLGRPDKEITDITRGDWFDKNVTVQHFEKRFANEKTNDPVRQFMEFDRHLWLIDESLKLTDAVTMASGLECRVPFLDPTIVQWSHATKSNWHVDYRTTKKLLKETYRNILPPHLFTLKKASFYPPLAKWLRRETAPLVEEALQAKRINEFFDTTALTHIFEDHRSKKRYGLHSLSSIIQLSNWFETVYDS